ncbi:hypothetical protein GWK47_025877 [Chionoecetes opilio]|uniref:Uncharacterized protein n=1 Tax=Chionoecetes opilio TaxID=41210 RepID=A0A8J8WF99_CHIOP|nr:hypothetical protein GWK47_025877 [Chionoecetes opilio]
MTDPAPAPPPEVIQLVTQGDGVTSIRNLLLQGEAKVDDTDSNGMTALHHASYKGNGQLCGMLIEHPLIYRTLVRHMRWWHMRHIGEPTEHIGRLSLHSALIGCGLLTHVLSSHMLQCTDLPMYSAYYPVLTRLLTLCVVTRSCALVPRVTVYYLPMYSTYYYPVLT